MIRIPKSIAAEISEHANGIKPIESCGYFAGIDGTIKRFFPMTNVDNSEEHFSFAPKEMFAALKESRKDGWSLIAVYHSHPATPARFSEEDRRLAQDPDMVYMILSLMNGEEDLRAFRLTDGEIVPEPIEYID